MRKSNQGGSEMYQKVSTDLSFVSREKDVRRFWEENHIFEKSSEPRAGGKPFTFYDGPPTANGKPHKTLCFLAHCRSPTRAFEENISPMREGRCALSGGNLTYAGVSARFWGKNLTHAGGPARSFGKKTHLCEMAGAHFRGRYFTHARGLIQSSGKKSHACR